MPACVETRWRPARPPWSDSATTGGIVDGVGRQAMTTAATALPLLGLRITAGPVELRGVTDDLLGPLAELATDIHDPDFMPFSFPWSLTSAPEMARNVAQYHWGKRASFSPAQWTADFAVFYQGELVGCQGFSTKDYLIVRGGETG